MAVTRSRSTTPHPLPDDLYYLAPSFPTERLTVAEIKKFLLKHHVSSANCNRKAEFVALFKSQVLPKREKLLKKLDDTAKIAMKTEEVEEGSGEDAGADTLQSGANSDDEEPTEKRAPRGWTTLFNPFSPPSGASKSRQTSKNPTIDPGLMPKFEPSSDSPQSRRSTLLNPPSKKVSFSDPPESCLPSPSPVPKLPNLAKQFEELDARIASLEKDVYDAYECLRAQSKHREYLEQTLAKLWELVYGEQGLANTLSTTAKKNGRGNGKGKEAVATDEEEEL